MWHRILVLSYLIIFLRVTVQFCRESGVATIGFAHCHVAECTVRFNSVGFTVDDNAEAKVNRILSWPHVTRSSDSCQGVSDNDLEQMVNCTLESNDFALESGFSAPHGSLFACPEP